MARLRGAGEEPPLLLLAHLDVVEAKREDWSVDPFTLLEKDGFFYGRGTADDKAMAAIFTELFVEYARAKHAAAPRPDPRAHRGRGGRHRERRAVAARAPPAARRRRRSSSTRAAAGRCGSGRYLLHAVQAAEKTYADFELTVRDKGGHSSRPTPANPIYRLADALGRLARHRFPVELNPVTRAYLAQAASVESGETAADMAALAKDPGDAAAAERLSGHPSYNALLRTTCTATQLAGGHANNALPQLATAIVNCRILPGHEIAEVQEQLAAILAEPELAIAQVDADFSAPGRARPRSTRPSSPWSSASPRRRGPGVPVVPTMSAGATDSRYFRGAGIPAYGVSGIFHDIDDVRAHGKDERLGVRQFYEGQAFLGRLVEALAAAGAR